MKNIATILFVLFIISACKNKNNEPVLDNTKEIASEVIQLTDDQIKLAGIKTGKIEKRKISETLECSGIIDVSPKDKATISPAISGFIKDILVKEGDFIKTGTKLVSLTHPEFINLQQKYLENKSQGDYFEQEFKRQGELTVENAASIKNMQKAQAEYWVAQAAYKSSKAQLEMLGTNILNLEKDEFNKEFFLVSPITGYVTNISGNKGKFTETTDIICEIINPSNLIINLTIFEKDIQNIKAGQNVEFYPVHSSNLKFNTYIQNVGININNTDRTTKAICVFENTGIKLHPGMIIRAKLNTSEKETFVLPTSAVTTIDKSSFVFIKKEDGFVKRQVNVGIEQNNFVEILTVTDEILNSEIVINGVYYLLSDSETNE